MLTKAPKDAPWEIEIEVYNKEDLSCVAELDGAKIQGLFLNFHARYSLKFLKSFPNLKYLLIGGAVRDYTSLSLCPHLEELYLSECLIDDLSGLSGLPIKRLTLERIRSKQESLDFPRLPQLAELSLTEVGKLSELDFLKAIPSLQVLRLCHQKITRIPDLSHMSHFHTLTITDCKHLKSWVNLRSAQSLQVLSVWNSPMNYDDITAISQIIGLKQLHLREISYKAKNGIQLAQALQQLGLESKIVAQIKKDA